MEPLDLKQFEWKIEVRQLTMDDFDELVEMEERCFPGMQTWGREHIESQLKTFPEGQLCVEIDGRLAASSSSLILDFDPSLEWHNWKAVADDGFIRNHNPTGTPSTASKLWFTPIFAA